MVVKMTTIYYHIMVVTNGSVTIKIEFNFYSTTIMFMVLPYGSYQIQSDATTMVVP